MTVEERYEYLRLLEVKWLNEARSHLFDFTLHTMPTFQPNWFHKSYFDILDQFARGEIKKLMVFVPPQHGKSEGSTRRLPAYLLGLNPELKIAIVSYSGGKAAKFNREIQRVIDSPEYAELFPETRIAKTSESNGASGNWVRNTSEVEVVGHRGGFKAVGVGGALTGEPVDIMIIDDIYKDAKSAWSETVRSGIEDWFDTVADTRLHNDSQVLIVFTRWHEKDLAAYLLEKENDWHVLKFPALKEGPPSDYDPRHEGEPLWPERHSQQKLEGTKERNPHVFRSLYQQDPKPYHGLLYKSLRTYKELPAGYQLKKAIIDTADTGEDYLCCIAYLPTPTGIYLLDVYYTQDGMETTEQATATFVSKHQVDHVRVESNNGGRGFARHVEENCRRIGNFRSSFSWYHQSLNKEVRIFTNAARVQNMVFFPEGWDRLWPEFHRHVTNYMSQGQNKHDDCADALTMVVEAELNPAYNLTTV